MSIARLTIHGCGLTQARFERIAPHLAVPRGNVSHSNQQMLNQMLNQVLNQVLNAILHVAEHGCKWRRPQPELCAQSG